MKRDTSDTDPSGNVKIVEASGRELSPLHLIRTEVNLAGLPFFALSRQDAKRKQRTLYKTRVERDGKILEVLWYLTSNVDYGHPGPFDRKVHKAIEYIINEQGLPVENPIVFSTYSIVNILGIEKSGRTYGMIGESLKRIVATTVESKGTFYSKSRQQYINDTFHLYERVLLKGETLPDGSIAESTHLYLNQWYLDSINSFYIRPIDFDYLLQLKSDIAGRLYELLGLKFHGVLLNQRPYWKVEYGELCSLLPITPQKYLSHARTYLEPAHKELVKTGFLSKVVWQSSKKKEWHLFYYPGKKAKQDFKGKALQEELQLSFPESVSMSPNAAKEVPQVSEDVEEGKRASKGQNERSMDSSDLISEERELFSLLRQRKIGRRSALEMVKAYPERIKEKVEIFDWAMRSIRQKIQSPTGFLRCMIEDDWDAPEGFVAQAAQERAQGEARAQRQAQKQKDKEEHYQQWCSMSPQQKVRGELWLWEHGFAREQGRKPTAKEMRERERELIAKLPNEEEYRRRLFGSSK